MTTMSLTDKQGQPLHIDNMHENKLGQFGLGLFFFVSIARFNDQIPGIASIPFAKLALLIMLVALFVEPKRKLDPYAKLQNTRPYKRMAIGSLNALVVWLIVCVGFSVAISSSFPNSVQFLLLDFSTSIAMYYFTVKFCRTPKAIIRMLSFIAFACAVNSVIVIQKNIMGDRGGISYALDPNDSAAIFVASIPCIIFFFNRSLGSMKKLLLIGAVLVTALATLTTQSRGGLLGLFVAAFLLANANSDGAVFKRYALVGIMVAIAAGGAMLFLTDDAKDRLSSVTDLDNDYNTSEEGRFGIWSRGAEALAERPWGWGAAQYPVVDYWMGGKYQTAHNLFVQITIEGGIQAGIVLFLVFLRSNRYLVKCKDRNDPVDRIAITLRCSLVGYLFCAMFLSLAYFALLYLMLGLIESTLRLASIQKTLEETGRDQVERTA